MVNVINAPEQRIGCLKVCLLKNLNQQVIINFIQAHQKTNN
jgi:hypothetical protein